MEFGEDLSKTLPVGIFFPQKFPWGGGGGGGSFNFMHENHQAARVLQTKII